MPARRRGGGSGEGSSSSGDGITRTAADARYLRLAGGRLTGKLTLDGDPTADSHAATKSYVDDNGGLSQGAADARYLQVAGGAMTGDLTLAGAPTADDHAANKAYVDDNAGGGGGLSADIITLYVDDIGKETALVRPLAPYETASIGAASVTILALYPRDTAHVYTVITGVASDTSFVDALEANNPKTLRIKGITIDLDAAPTDPVAANGDWHFDEGAADGPADPNEFLLPELAKYLAKRDFVATSGALNITENDNGKIFGYTITAAGNTAVALPRTLGATDEGFVVGLHRSGSGLGRLNVVDTTNNIEGGVTYTIGTEIKFADFLWTGATWIVVNVVRVASSGSGLTYADAPEAAVVSSDFIPFFDASDSNRVKREGLGDIIARGGALRTSGGTMSGKITLDGDPTANRHAATKQYVDAVLTTVRGGVSAAFDTMSELAAGLATKLNLSGGTMTGLLTLSGPPTSALHAATKKYVDDKVAGATPATSGDFRWGLSADSTPVAGELPNTDGDGSFDVAAFTDMHLLVARVANEPDITSLTLSTDATQTNQIGGFTKHGSAISVGGNDYTVWVSNQSLTFAESTTVTVS